MGNDIYMFFFITHLIILLLLADIVLSCIHLSIYYMFCFVFTTWVAFIIMIFDIYNFILLGEKYAYFIQMLLFY